MLKVSFFGPEIVRSHGSPGLRPPRVERRSAAHAVDGALILASFDGVKAALDILKKSATQKDLLAVAADGGEREA